jgi:DNA polymerase II small subunit
MATAVESEQNDMLTFSKKNALLFLEKRNVAITSKLKSELAAIDSVDDVLDFIKRATTPISLGTIEVVRTYSESIKKREVSDFVKYYTNRFLALSNILRARDFPNLLSIRRIIDIKTKENVSTIGIVLAKNITKNGHYSIELEDRTGVIKVLIMNSKTELFNQAKNLVVDEVIAISGMFFKEVIFADEITFPDIPVDKVLKKSPSEGYAVFTGDIHIGSAFFYGKEFQKFIDWISGKNTPRQHKDIVSRIKYLIIPGDVIDGAGIYPGQEKDLAVLSIKEQYKIFTDFIIKIPNHIHIVICPGNHDAMRLAEPQPPLYEEFVGQLARLPNVTLVSSPSVINIDKQQGFEGFEILMYHGFSMPYYADNVLEIREAGGLSNPENIMKFYLQRRHFAPSHGSTQFIPDIREDPLVITHPPDFLLTGHIHKVSVNVYKGVTMINSSGWVAQSDYQKKFGLIPDPCRAILVNLHTRDIKILNFMNDEERK